MAVSISVEVTIPNNLINDANVRSEIEKALRTRTGPDMQRLFRKTVEGWDNPARFTQRMANGADYVSVTVYTTQDQYAIVNFGSPPHAITPRRGGMLRFQPGYRAATRPKIIGSRAKQRSGNVISARAVNHPGFEAREFDVAVAEEIAKTFPDDVQDAIAIGSKIF